MTFLEQVAASLLKKYGNNLSNISVVFPNRRARLFFNQYICEQASGPVWAPAYDDLTSLFTSASTLQIADPIQLNYELYKSYANEIADSEPFDEFYFFGETLLHDFNDIDKNLVDAQTLFTNLSELDVLKDDFSHLTEEQRSAINRFFDITKNESNIKEKFASIWNALGAIYQNFNNALDKQNDCYEGKLFRNVIEAIKKDGIQNFFPKEKYIFVGFNVLTKCEQKLFRQLKREDKAFFFWDYDNYYYKNEQQEAGRFIRQNISLFGQYPDFQLDSDRLAVEKKNITIIESPSESSQAGYIQDWLQENQPENGFEKADSAIVLCNEQLLQPVINALSDSQRQQNLGKANITMGFPMQQTAIYSLLYTLVDFQQKGINSNASTFRYNLAAPILRHPYINKLYPDSLDILNSLIQNNIFYPTVEDLKYQDIFCNTTDSIDLIQYLIDIIKKIARLYISNTDKEDEEENIETSLPDEDLHQESLFRAYQLLNRLHDVLNKNEIPLEKATTISLIKRMFSSNTVPFHGEPACGLQIMGLLETRNMDFKNLIMMSINEGILPKTDNDSSFIPHFIRKAFGMTTIEHQDSLFAYYFYRMLQRAENIVLSYSSAKQQTGKSEKSRLIAQLLCEYPHEIKRISLQSEPKTKLAQAITIKKTEEILHILKETYTQGNKILSPSAINTYCNCPLHFYMKYVEKIMPPNDISDEMDNAALGNIFHRSAELIYREIGNLPLVRKEEKKEDENFIPFQVTTDSIKKINNDFFIDKIISIAFDEEFFHKKRNETTPKTQYNGEQLIYFDIVKKFIKRLLAFDSAYTPFKILGLESKIHGTIQLSNSDSLNIGGIIDRIDEKDGNIRILDYKTGRPKTPWKSENSCDVLFEESNKRNGEIMQAFLYTSIIYNKISNKNIQPALLHIQETNTEDYSPNISDIEFKTIKEDFDTSLKNKLEEIMNPVIEFRQTKILKNCEYCDFKEMCNRTSL